MADRNPGFEVVGGIDAEPKPQADPNGVAVRLIQMALVALSQRALVAVADMFTLITVASAFWLWASIPTPNDRQIIALSIYALFVLAANWIVRGRK
jgi:hypothetical protein